MKAPLGDVLLGLFQLRQISKIKQYDVIDKKYVRARGRFSKKKHPGGTYLLKVKQIAKKEMLMTIKVRPRAIFS